MRSRFLLIALPVFWSCSAHGQISVDGTEEVVAGIEALIELRIEIDSRYAMFAIGESHRQLQGKPNQVTGVWKIRSGNQADDFSYLANGHVVPQRITNRQAGTVLVSDRQHWVEIVTCSGDAKARSGSALTTARRGYKTKAGDDTLLEFLDENRLMPGFLEPFDDLVLHPMFLDNPIPNERWIERLFPGECELLNATKDFDGNARSKWRWRHGELDFEVRIFHAKEYGYLPTEIHYLSKIKALPNLNGFTRIEWKLDDSRERYLPRRLAAGYRHGTLVKKHFLKFEWAVGDAANEELFSSESHDFRLPYGKRFNFKFDTYTVKGPRSGTFVPGTQWVAPSDLVVGGTRDLPIP